MPWGIRTAGLLCLREPSSAPINRAASAATCQVLFDPFERQLWAALAAAFIGADRWLWAESVGTDLIDTKGGKLPDAYAAARLRYLT
jgi:hypothetical protein